MQFHSYVESKKQNNWRNVTKQKQTYGYREYAGGCQVGGGGGLSEIGEGG